jgi:creatinine amidohydrolase/Fe(II)-dependent formamide hydrolase-like protein
LNSATKDNFKLIILVNSHGTNESLIREVVFDFVNKQFEKKDNIIRPVMIINTFDANNKITVELKQQSGRHADWVETAILYDILGEKYFTPELISKIEIVEKEEKERGIDILGAPIELRSKRGTLGALLPCGTSLSEASERISQIIENYGFELIKKYLLELENLTNFTIEKVKSVNL